MFEKGRPITAQERAIFKPYFAQVVLEQTRIIEGKVPFWLRSDMCGVVLKRRIYFRDGAYQPNTKSGTELLGHELMHVSQFLFGMTWLKYLWSCRYGYAKSAYEIEAYEKGRLIAQNLNLY